MRKIKLLMHVSLDGFVAGPNGEMDWIRVDEDMFDYVESLTDSADVNLFGRTTYQMMEGYWPTAGEQPGASKHDIEHSRWYNNVKKIVFSYTLSAADAKDAAVVNGDVAATLDDLKQQPGKNMVVIGSAGLVWSLSQLNLIDEYWLNLNPVVLGSGKPLFNGMDKPLDLKLLASRVFSSGVIAVQYGKA